MNNIDSTRSKFFPKSKVDSAGTRRVNHKRHPFVSSNSPQRRTEIENLTSRDAKVSIASAVKDYAQIRKAVDMAPEIDNSDKVARLKQQIQSGTYSIDYDKLADKMLASEF